MARRVDSRGDIRGLAGALRAVAPIAVCALAIASVLAGPAMAARTTTAAKPVKQKFSMETPLTSFQAPDTDASKFSFTASGPNAAQARMQTVERAFRFTPSGQSYNRKALSLGVSTRVAAVTPDRSRAAVPTDPAVSVPTNYGVDVSVAWKGFALSTGFSHVEPGPMVLLGSRRDAVDIGVSYRGRNWKTSLQGRAEEGQFLSFAPLERRYSVELGGAYSVAPRFSVTGGVRYKLAPLAPSILEMDRADQAVYFGTNFAF